MEKQKFLRRMAQVLVVCLLCVNCIGGSLSALAATKLNGTASALSLSKESVSGSLYLYSVYTLGDKYVGVVREAGDWKSFLASSTDRVNWALLGEVNGVAFGNGIAATAVDDTIRFTADGVTWNQASLGRDLQIASLQFSNGQFIMQHYGQDGRNVMFSADCLTWYDMQGDLPEGFDGYTFSKADGKYYVFSQDAQTGNSAFHYVSSIGEGKTGWTTAPLPDGARFSFDNGKTFGAEYHMWGEETSVHIYYLSTDGINWAAKDYNTFAAEWENSGSIDPASAPLHCVGDGTLTFYERIIGQDESAVTSVITLNSERHVVRFSINGELLPVDAAFVMPDDPTAPVALDPAQLAAVTDAESAAAAINDIAKDLSLEQKSDADNLDLMTLFAEEAAARAASQTVSGGQITLDSASLDALRQTTYEARNAVDMALYANGFQTRRNVNSGATFKTTANDVTITVDASAAPIGSVRVDTPEYAVLLPQALIEEAKQDGGLVITVTSGTQAALMASNGVGATFAASDEKLYTVKINKPVSQNIKVSLPPASGDTKYQAVMTSSGEAVGGKYNPVNGKIEAKINGSGTYVVKQNKKDFSDIASKSKEMQEAITILASKGIINGTGASTFSPNGSITRAEIAALIMRTLSKVDANADGGFTDVVKSDWFFGAVGSAKRHGIINGTSDTTFSPRTNIQKDQITAIAARTLKSEMGYYEPWNTFSVLNVYSDKSSIPSWFTGDIALATRENLVVKRADGTFSPSTVMTRGDAALMLYRMFMRIW